MMTKRIYILPLFCLLLIGCKKEYKVEIERIEVYQGPGKYVSRDYKTKIFKAKHELEAAQLAYEDYVINIITFGEAAKKNSSFLWIPVDYKITDSKGNRVPKNLKSVPEDLTVEFMVCSDIDSLYYEWLGHYKYLSTPYGRRHPKSFHLKTH